MAASFRLRYALGIMVSKFLAVLLFVSLAAPAEEPVDLAVVHRIKSEAFENSKAMEHLFYLTDVYGPRLTNSPGFRAAADWAVKRLQEYGLTNVKQEKWGPFGRSWEYTRFAANMLEPKYAPLIGFPLAWTPGTSGRMTGEPVLAVLRTDADLEKFKGKLKGKIVLTMPAKDVAMVTDPLARRLTDAELAARMLTPDPSRLSTGMPTPTGPPVNREEAEKFAKKVAQFLKDEGALLILQHGYNGDGGTVFASSGGSYKSGELVPLPTVAITPEHYNRILRLLDHKIPVKLEFEIEARFIDAPVDSFNVIGEIEGGSKKNEIVMLGAHLDSWHGGDGATDNATGSSVAIEAVRILKSLNIKMDRTVRIALWSGEEEGLLGSQAYVKEHFADQKTMVMGSEYSALERVLQRRRRQRKIPRHQRRRQRYVEADFRGLARAVPRSGCGDGGWIDARRDSSAPPAPITPRSLWLGCQDSRSCRTRSNTARGHITRTWTCTIACSAAT